MLLLMVWLTHVHGTYGMLRTLILDNVVAMEEMICTL